MAEASGNLKKRVISGVLGGALAIGLVIYGNVGVLIAACALASVLAVREFSRMIFSHSKMPESANYIYRILCILILAALIMRAQLAPEILAFGAILVWLSGLWLARNRVENPELLSALSLGTFGLLYCVYFPYFTVETVRMPHGNYWFLFLLLVVFFGDIFAYFGGRFWGRSKLMERVSPNKTWAGAFSGLAGSCLAGGLFMAWRYPHFFWGKTLVFCLICGAAAQTGDLLISLLKRVAHVKDSGAIMPGHGGVLDRLDGVLIACPLVYFFALYVRPY